MRIGTPSTYRPPGQPLTLFIRYVPHANRALRNFNMYLNVRQPPLQSRFPLSLFSFLFPRPTPVSTPVRRSRNPSPSPPPSKRSSSIPIAPIPPASSPRGELIFSSRVDRNFRDSYERYRSTFERRRDEREREAFVKTWKGWMYYKMPWVKNHPLNPLPGLGPSMSRTGSGSLRGRGSSGTTPSTSRRSSPMSSRTPRQGSFKSGGSRAQSPAGQQHPLASEARDSGERGG